MASRKNALTLALGSAVVATLATAPLANAQDNPFKLHPLKSGYQAADDKSKEGKCGEGKCGEGKCGSSKNKKKDSSDKPK